MHDTCTQAYPIILTFLTELSLYPAGTGTLEGGDAGAAILTAGMAKGCKEKRNKKKGEIRRQFSLRL